MASQSGTKARPLEDQVRELCQRLHDEPYRFDFFTAVRRLENLHPDKPRIGHSKRPHEDPLRFCQEASLAFPPRTISAFGSDVGARAPRMSVNFLGLLGPNGPLPLHITQFIRDRVRNHGDQAMSRFLDVFHHRMVSLFYRAWTTGQQAVQYERGEDDNYARYIGSMFGIGMESLRHVDAIPDEAKLHYSGHLACQTRHPEGLAALLEDYYGLPVDLAEFMGQWLPVPKDCQCRLGESPDTGSLGVSAIVGSRMWDCQQRFRLRFGPMNLTKYQRLLPGGDSLRRLIAWVKNYTADELTWEVQLILMEKEVPPLKLGATAQLGWTTWLTSRPLGRDADDLVLQPAQAEGL